MTGKTGAKWGSTYRGLTSTEQKVLMTMQHVESCRTDHLATVFGSFLEVCGRT